LIPHLIEASSPRPSPPQVCGGEGEEARGGSGEMRPNRRGCSRRFLKTGPFLLILPPKMKRVISLGLFFAKGRGALRRWSPP